MNISKHTPGPWKYLAEKEGMAGAITAKTGWVCDFDTDPSPANANLIAAAPDLLAVLQELQESASYWSEYDVPLGVVDRINSAIAKAKGEQA